MRDKMLDNLYFIVNPVARSCPDNIVEQLECAFAGACVEVTTKAGDSELLAQKAIAKGAKTIVACGGDGTLRQVASVVYGAAKSEITLGVLPLGTVNQTAALLGIPFNLPAAFEVIKEGKEREVFPGIASFVGRETNIASEVNIASEIKELFFIGVSAGPDAEAVYLVNPSIKKHIGRYAYALSFIKGLLFANRQRVGVKVREGDKIDEFDSSEVIVLATVFYGWDLYFSIALTFRETGLLLVAASGGILSVLALFFVAYILPLLGMNNNLGERINILNGEASLTFMNGKEGNFQIDGDHERARGVTLGPSVTPLIFLAP
jgi:diacylglycerol kinase family enzyme